MKEIIFEDADRTPRINPAQREVLRRAVGCYGARAQMAKVAEELRELADECEKACRAETFPCNLAHERADVAIVLWQFDNLLLPSLAALVREKLGSQIERLERRMDDGE